MIVAATLLCDRKSSSQLVATTAIFQMEGVDHVYINIETEGKADYTPLHDFLTQQRIPHLVEYWWRSKWPGARPNYDQDQKRLLGIVVARNMAIDFALAKNADKLLFVDADVIVQPDGLLHLLALEKPLCGGHVPGRAVTDAGCFYVFPGDVGISDEGDYYRCGHCTCGYMLIDRSIFSRLRFRWGMHLLRDEWMSEDPAFCSDAHVLGLSDGVYVAKKAVAQHWDDPAKPLLPTEYHRTIEESLVGTY